MSKSPEHIPEQITVLFISIRDGLDQIEQKIDRIINDTLEEQEIDHDKEILLIIGYLTDMADSLSIQEGKTEKRKN